MNLRSPSWVSRRCPLHGISKYLLCSSHSVGWKTLNAVMTVLHDPLLGGWLTDNGLLHRSHNVTLSPLSLVPSQRCPETLLQQWGYGPDSPVPQKPIQSRSIPTDHSLDSDLRNVSKSKVGRGTGKRQPTPGFEFSVPSPDFWLWVTQTLINVDSCPHGKKSGAQEQTESRK